MKTVFDPRLSRVLERGLTSEVHFFVNNSHPHYSHILLFYPFSQTPLAFPASSADHYFFIAGRYKLIVMVLLCFKYTESILPSMRRGRGGRGGR